MPVKSKSRVVAEAVTAKGGTKAQKPVIKTKPAAKAQTAKSPAPKSAVAAPRVAKLSATTTAAAVPAAQSSKQRVPAAAAAHKNAVAPAVAKLSAAIPAQKPAIVVKTNQPRIPMAAPSVTKPASGTKSAAKAAPSKIAGVKTSAVVKPVILAATAPIGAKSAAPKTAGTSTKMVPEGKLSASPALGAAQFQAQRQAALKPAVPRAMPAAVANSVAQRISVPASPVPVPAAAVATPKDLALKAQQAQQALAAKKPISVRHGFKTSEWIVYPAHGVGRIVAIEEQEIAGMALELFVITFEKDKMTLRVPTGKSASVGMRKLAEEGVVKRAMETLKGKARIKRTMWSRRAQEFEQKINSGDLVSIAEVVRDLFRAETQPEQSYSERQLYEAALDRMAREIAAVEKIDERGAVQRVTEVLSKSAKTRRAETELASGDIKAA